MASSTKQDFSVLDLIRAFRRHKTTLLIVFCGMALVVFAAVLCKPRKYSSEAKLLLRVGRETATLDPTATLGEVMPVSRNSQNEINSVLQVLRSRDLIEQVVERIGAERLLEAETSQPWALTALISDGVSSIKSLVKGFMDGKPAGQAVDATMALRIEAADLLAGNVQVSAPQESTVVSIYATALSPPMAQEIAEVWTEVFLAEHLRLTNTEGSRDFFVEQCQLLGSDLKAAQEQLREVKDNSHVATVEGQKNLLEALKSEVDIEHFRNARQIRATEARRADLEMSLRDLPAVVLAQRIDGSGNNAHDGMRQQLYELEIRERELLERYTPGHPLVKAIRNQVAEVRRILDRQDDSEQQTTYAANPAKDALQLELIQIEAQLAALHASADSLAQQQTDIQQRFRELNAYALNIQDMERQVKMLDTSYRLYAEKSEQARINEAMASQRITSVRVMQTATLDLDPVGPSRSMLLAIGIGLACLAACGMALLLEYAKTVLPIAEDMKAARDVPVYPTAPNSSRQLAGTST